MLAFSHMRSQVASNLKVHLFVQQLCACMACRESQNSATTLSMLLSGMYGEHAEGSQDSHLFLAQLSEHGVVSIV